MNSQVQPGRVKVRSAKAAAENPYLDYENKEGSPFPLKCCAARAQNSGQDNPEGTEPGASYMAGTGTIYRKTQTDTPE